MRPLPRDPDDRQARRKGVHPRQHGGAAGGAVAHSRERCDHRRAPQETELRHRRHRQVGPGDAGERGEPARAGVRRLLRLLLPAPRPQPLPDLSLAQRRADRTGRQRRRAPGRAVLPRSVHA